MAAIILVLITSMGIYGFLSAAYQETYQKLTVQQNQIEFLENKSKFYEDDIERFDKELAQISDNISALSNAKATSIQVRDTSVVGGIRTTVSTAELRLAQNRITAEENNRKDVYLKRTVAADSLQKYKLEILSLQNNADTVGELGPLQYLSGLTGTPMDKIINILLLIIIFVFDPLAISLVVAANFAFDKARPKKNLYGEFVDEEEVVDVLEDEEFEPWDDTEHLTSSKKNKDRLQDSIDELKVEKGKLPDEARGVEPADWKVIDEDDKSTQDSDDYSYLENNIDKVLSKKLGKWTIQLKNGDIITLPKTPIQRYITKDPDNTINYM